VWSGDSRIYLVRDRAIIPQSRDHTEVQELVAEGLLKPEEARTWPRRNVVTRAIGVHDDPELEIADGVLQTGDAFVLCSDGLTSHVEDGEILREVMANASQPACDALVDLTLAARGATDNVTVVVARYEPDGGRRAAKPTSGVADADNAPDMSRSRFSPGTRLNGIYEVDHLIASGGMGEVYKGHTVQTGDVVAIKVLLPEFAENDAALGLFAARHRLAQSPARGDRPLLRLHHRAGAAPSLSGDGVRRRAVAVATHPARTADL